MLTKDLIFAFRNLRKNKLIASINVLGLAIGISACLVIFLIVHHEFSFNQFISERDRIYRIYSEFTGTYGGHNRGVPTAVAVAIKDGFTGVEAASNFHTFKAKVNVPDEKGELKNFEYSEAAIAGPEYFDVFSDYQWVIGNPQQSLGEPFKVVLTESQARLYFGNVAMVQAIGKEIRYRDSLILTVSGIIKDVEDKTDFNFTDFISLSTIEKSWLSKRIQLNDWSGTNSDSQLFVKLLAGTSSAKIKAQFPKIAAVYKEKNKESHWTYSPILQPLSDLHFSSIGIFNSSRSVADKATLQILVAVAIMVLVIASINFINLETAQASRRAKEVGVRKVMGSSRVKLVSQFLLESFILTCAAAIVSIVLTCAAVQYFTDFIPAGLSFNPAEPAIIMFLISCIIVVTLTAGLYPAFVLSSYQPALALKNLASFNGNVSRSATIRKGLTVFQFAFSQVLIIATIAISMQIRYMLNKDLGFTSEAIVYFYTPWKDKVDRRFLLKHELEQLPEVENLSIHNDPPSYNGYTSSTLEFDDGKEKKKLNVYKKAGDSAYLKLYNIALLAGRNLQQTDTAVEYLINETYLHQLGYENATDVLGKTVDKRPIIGVVRDFHTASLRSPIEPVIIFNEMESFRCFGFKMHTRNKKVEDLGETMTKVEAAWKKIYPDQKFTYSFLDDTIKKFYETEQRIGKLARTATIITILISCLGLFGLSSFTVIQRTKEIGIRKVLGATVSSITILLSKDFLKLVVIAFALSAVPAYYVVQWWLKDFAYRMEITAWLFVIAGLTSLLTAFITVSIKTINAAQSDPVKSLRYE
jgi:putative ABC transport system permease protein